MKSKFPVRSLLSLLLAVTVVSIAVPAGRVFAQSSAEDRKIRLMADVLRLRDAGDYAGALISLDQLSAVAPNDASVARLRSEITSAARAREAAAQRAAAAPAPAASAANVPAMIEVKIPDAAPRSASPAVESAAAASAAAEAEADALVAAESARISAALAGAATQRATARALGADGQFAAAIATLDAALASLPMNSLTQKTVAEIKRDQASLYFDQAQSLLTRGDTAGARAALAAASALEPGSSRSAGLTRQLSRAETQSANAASFTAAPGVDAEFLADRAATEQLIAKGRAQYVAGDIDGAQSTFRTVEAQAPDNTVAKGFLLRIAQEKAETGALNREKTRTQLLEEVAKGWQRPGIYQERARDDAATAATAPLVKKLNIALE